MVVYAPRHLAHMLFKVIKHRYERGSTLITSNNSIREWPEMLAGDEVLVTAILDRLLHYCHVLQIDGRSFACSTWNSSSPKSDDP